MSEIFHVDTQFLRNALGIFENLNSFEQAARSRKAAERAANVATLVDALDLCNLLILGDRIVFDSDVGGGRGELKEVLAQGIRVDAAEAFGLGNVAGGVEVEPVARRAVGLVAGQEALRVAPVDPRADKVLLD